MKLSSHLLFALAVLTPGLPAHADAHFSGRNYVRSHRFEHPLDSWDNCNAYSESGAEAAELAYDTAMAACRADFNVDCVAEGATYDSIMSREFVGYKACEATVVVHGYRGN